MHNLAYQGLFPRSALAYLGIPEGLFHPHGVEYFGRLNLLKAGLLYADAISTVSPRYSEEIRTPAFGEGLDGVLRERAPVLHGILNGVDYAAWDPETDGRLAANYSAADPSGKARCKEDLERAFGFEPEAGTPLFGTISRMADQKGFDLLAAAVPAIAALPLPATSMATSPGSPCSRSQRRAKSRQLGGSSASSSVCASASRSRL